MNTESELQGRLSWVLKNGPLLAKERPIEAVSITDRIPFDCPIMLHSMWAFHGDENKPDNLPRDLIIHFDGELHYHNSIEAIQELNKAVINYIRHSAGSIIGSLAGCEFVEVSFG